ncbi:Myosin light chain kinase, smooth muscle [Echinococcus granulosus]|uniref:Myosin light chain kinase, smooth muscle n=1 Tax=Echinococcus granulosus TaxID=6210 RepID=W6U2Y8_ECHGR|nr:Myosin light chain kinase, smooth muscle [Echinococcus granulosus]EUB55433.1 Myosin light chain kinase, smooth muscle [Echinococcus granulosus]
MGEPRIKRGFKPQETTYATIVVSVGEKPKADVDEVENEPAAASAGVEGKKDEPTKEVPEAEKLPEEQEVDEAKRKKKMSKGESGEEKPKKKRKSIDGGAEPRSSETLQEEEVKPIQEVRKGSLPAEPAILTGNVVSLITGAKLQLSTSVSLDARQFKTEKFWWTKDGKPFLDVDGITPRKAIYTSKSKPKPPRSTDIELTKKEPATVEDTATYVLMGEPRVKRGFKSQETTYATIIVKVSDNPPAISGEITEASSEISVSNELREEEQIKPEPIAVTEEMTIIEDEEKPKDNQAYNLVGKAAEADIKERKEKRKKKSKSREGEGEEVKRKFKKKKASDEDVEKLEEAARVVEKIETKPIETVELRCIEANANKRLGHEKIPIPSGEPLCLTVTGIPPEVPSVLWTLNGQPVRSGKRVQRLLEPNPLGKRYDGELMAQLYLDSTVLLDSGDYEITIEPTDLCSIKAHLSIPVEIVPAKKALAERRGRMENQEGVKGEGENVNVLQVQPNLCQPLGFAACEGQSISLVADLSVPVDKVPPESVSWSRNGVLLSPDDPSHDFSIQASEKNQDHTSVILHKPAVTLDDVGFYSVTYNPLPTIKEEPLAEAADEEGYGTGWEVDFPELLIFPAETVPCPDLSKTPVFTKELPKEIRVSEGDTITLDAEIAKPLPGLTPIWSVNGRDINPSRTSEYVVWDSGNYFALTIPAASKHHLGEYELRLSARQGREPVLTSCHVRGKSDFGAMPHATPNRATYVSHGIAPMFTKKLTDLDCSSGETMELTCRVVGDPIPHFFWRHNGELVESDYHHRVRSYDNTSTLKIFSVEPRDRGTYICSAVNELGKTQTSAKISVDGTNEPIEETEVETSRIRPPRYGLPRTAPEGLMVESATPTELTIRWSPVSQEEPSDMVYTVEMSKDNGYFWSPVLTGLQTTRATLPHTIATPLQPIQLRVHAENALGTGPPSQPVLKIPPRACVPNMTGVKPVISNVDLTSVMITWSGPSGGAPSNVSYIVEVREGTRGDWKPVASGLKDKTYTYHLKPGVSTLVRVRAYNEFGTSEPCATAIANLPVEHLIPDFAIDPPWVSVIRPDVSCSEKSAYPGLMLHWKEAYLPEYCDDCVSGLKPIYTLEWKKGRTGPWRMVDDCIVDTTVYKLPGYIVRAVQEASTPTSQSPEIRVVCRNDYGSTLPTKSLRLTNFGLPKQTDSETEKLTRSGEALFSLPIVAPLDGEERSPLWLTSTDIENGVSLKWDETFRCRDGNLHGKYRMEYAVMPIGYTTEPEGLWEPVGPRSQPILGDSYCLDLPLHSSAEQRIRLLALTNNGSVFGWLNAYRQVRLPSKRQLLPSPVEGLRARVFQPKEKGEAFSVRLDWNHSGQTEGERILEEQLEPGVFFTPQVISYRVEVQENHGLWREIGTVIGSSKTFFEHKTPMGGVTLRYRVIPINRFGEGPEVEVPAVHIPKRLSELQGCVEDLKVLIVAPRSVFLRWRLGDEAIDALESMGRRVVSSSPTAARGMGDSGYEENADLHGLVRYCVERRDAFSSGWYPVATVESLQDELTGKVTLRDCPKEMYGNEYRVIAFLNNQPCAPSRPVRINVKTAELAPDLSYHKAKVDVSKVDEYQISYPEENLGGFFSSHVLASTLPHSLEEHLTFDIEAVCGNRKEWEKIATGLSSPVFSWDKVNPLLPYSFRVVGLNQFGVGLPSRATHVDAQVVIPDLSFVVPTVREAMGILEGREPPEMRWQTPKVYNLTQTLTPFTYEVQMRRVASGSALDEWEVFRGGLKQPRCSLEGLDPTQEYVLRVVAVTNFGRGEPSQPTRKRKSRARNSSQSMGNYSSLSSSYDSIPPQFENPSPEVVYVPCGGDLDLRCTLTSINLKNLVQFIWFFNYQEIPDVPKHEQFPSGYFQHVTGGGKSAQLRLFDLDERDFGTYTCKAVNNFGTTVKEFRVVRADAPVITEVPLPIVTLSVHHTLLLPCCVDAVPAARITWTRDSKRLTSSHRTWIGGETSSVAQLDFSANEREAELGELTVDASLRVERCVFQDAGLYTMIAENPAGRAQTSCIVRIEEKLSPRTITPRWSNIEKHYFVLHQIATGSFSRAHLLIDKKTSREYVGKAYALVDPMTRVLGAREFECLNRLHHNNVVEMVDAVVSDDYLVLVTERLSGNHLLEEIILGHTWTEAAATMLIKELLEAVAHVHEEGIVHLDIQPDNIIFPRGTSSRTAGLEGLMQALNSLSVDTAGAGGRSDVGVVSCFVKLTGFSMAQPIGQRTALQMSSIMPPALWCPDFAAPELLSITTALSTEDDSKVCVGFAADVWSIGVIAYLLLFGEHPVIRNADETLKVDDFASIGDEIAELMTASTEEFGNDVSPEAIDFLCHLLATEPCNRPTAKECLQHPWLAEGRRSARNLENSLNSLKAYQRIYQKRKTTPTGSLCRESFLRFAGRACIEAVPGRRSTTPPPSSESPMLMETQKDSPQLPRASSSDGGSSERGCSIDRDLTSRITTLMVPPEERFGFTGSGTSSLRSSLLHLDIDEYQINKSPLESPSPRLDPWSSSPSLLSADDSSEPIKRLCDNISKKRDEQILPVEPHLCEGPLKSTTKLAPIFSNPLRDSRIDPQTNSVFFSCQLASPPRLPAPELLYQRNDVRENLEALGMESFALCGGAISSGSGGAGNYNSGSVAAAWYLAGCLLSEAPGVSLGASSDGWLWLRLDDAQRGMAEKVVECVVRARNGKAKTRARILLPEPPSPPGRPGILQSASTEVLVGWTCGNDDSCEDFIYRVDVKYPDAKPVASAWRTVGYSVDCRFLISGLQPEQAYRVRVCVRNAVGWSAYSIASSEFRLHSGHARTLPLMDKEREWILRWRQASHPFGLSDHPEAMSTTASSKSVGAEHEAFRRPPPSGVVKEMIQAGGLFPHMEAVKMLCRTEGLISRGTFGNSAQLMTLIRCHPALVERGDLPNQRPEKQPLRLPAFLIARITRLTDASFAESLESQARQQALLLTLLRSTATTPASGGLEGAPLFTQQFGIRSPCLLPQGISLGWLANDAARPTVGLGLASWIPGGALLDVLLARGEFTEFSVARWVYQLLCALRWLHIAFQGRVHGRVDFDKVQAARRTSALPDIVLTGVEPTEPWERRADCFTAPELDDGGKCSALSDLWSVGAFAYILLLAESISTSLADHQASRTPTPAGEKAMDAVETSRRLQKRVSTVSLPGGYRHLDRPVVNLKAIKHLSKWGRRFVYNALQSEPMSRGSLDFWLENDWFSLRPEVVKQLAMNTIPSKYIRAFRPSENLYGVVPLFPDEADPLSTV